MNAIIFDIQRASYVDGPGSRTTVFFKGCNLRCGWCHNPEGMERKTQLMYFQSRCKHCGRCQDVCNAIPFGPECTACGKCATVCPNGARKQIGSIWDLEKLLDKVCEDVPFYGKEGGVTCSGGECLLQSEFVTEFTKELHARGIHTAIDTAGNLPWSCLEPLLKWSPLFLFDIKCYTEELHKKGTGVSNRLILSNYVKLIQENARVWVRIPIIGGFNANREELGRIAAFLQKNPPEKTQLLPYHTMGMGKTIALGTFCKEYSTPDKMDMENYKQLFVGWQTY